MEGVTPEVSNELSPMPGLEEVETVEHGCQHDGSVTVL